MPYEVKAIAANGQLVVRHSSAAREADARREARLEGLSVFQVRPLGRRASGPGTRRARLDVAAFAQELLTLLRAGLTLVSALEAIAEKESNAATRAVTENLLDQLRRGVRFSDALAASEAGFSELFIAGVLASERSGDLPEALERYIAYASRLDHARKKIVSALIYPVLLLVVGALITLFLIGYVVPKFAAVYQEAGSEVPWASALLLRLGRLIGTHPEWLALGAAGAAAGLAALVLQPAVRMRFGMLVRATPGIGPRIQVYELARLYRTLAMLLRSGTPVVRAFGMAARMLSGPLQQRLALARTQVSQGVALSQALQGNGLTTPVGARMLGVGERGGGMAEMLGRIADYHDEDIQRWVEHATRLFEPLLMALLGIVIGALVVLLYMPIFDLAGSVK